MWTTMRECLRHWTIDMLERHSHGHAHFLVQHSAGSQCGPHACQGMRRGRSERNPDIAMMDGRLQSLGYLHSVTCHRDAARNFVRREAAMLLPSLSLSLSLSFYHSLVLSLSLSPSLYYAGRSNVLK